MRKMADRCGIKHIQQSQKRACGGDLGQSHATDDSNKAVEMSFTKNNWLLKCNEIRTEGGAPQGTVVLNSLVTYVRLLT